MKYYLGILGASKTSHAALADESGRILARLETSIPLTIRGNPRIRDDIRETLRSLSSKVSIPIDKLNDSLESACVAMSGVYLQEDKNTLRQILEQIEFDSNKFVVCDIIRARFAATFNSCGGIINAGTGSKVLLQRKEIEEPIWADGWGSLLGDDGSGYDIGRKCIRSLLKGYDGRKKRYPELEKRVLDYLALDCSAKQEDEKILALIPWCHGIWESPRFRQAISDMAIPLVEEAEKGNCEFSKQLVKKGANDLFDSFEVANKHVGNHAENFTPLPAPLVLSGGLMMASEIYKSTIRSRLNDLNVKSGKESWEIMFQYYRSIVGTLAMAISRKPYVETVLPLHDELRASADKHRLFFENI